MHVLIRLGLVCCFLGLFTFGSEKTALAAHPAETVTLDEFWQHVDQTITTLRNLKSQPDETVNPALDTLADEWSKLDAVTAPDPEKSGNVVKISLNTDSIVSLLRKRPADTNQILTRFNALQAAHRVNPSRSSTKADLDALKVILQSPDFQWDQPASPLDEFLQQLWARINEWLNQLFGGNNVRIPVPSEAFTIVASLILLVILLFVFRNLFSDFFVDAAAKDEQMAGDELLTAESALQKAKDISRGGDYRTAVRYLYISSLLTLDERGLMRFDRSKTNREYLRSVAAFPQLSAPLRDVIDVFDRVWYGFQSLDEDSFQHYAEKVDQLREQKK